MRITIINKFYKPDFSPTAHLCAILAEDRAKSGDQVTVVASRGSYSGVASKGDSVVNCSGPSSNPKVLRLWSPGLGKSAILRRLLEYGAFYLGAARSMILLPRQDVIVALTTPPWIVIVAWLHKLLHPRAKIVLWNMDCYPEIAERSGLISETGPLSFFLRWVNRRVFRNIHQLIVLDEAMKKLLVTRYEIDPKALPVSVIPNFESLEMFPGIGSVERWGQASRVGLDGKFVVLYLGNMGVGHEFGVVVEAAKRLSTEPVVFLFVGDGSRRKELEQARDRYGLSNLILHHYVDKQTSSSVMASADMALITMSDSMLGVMSPSKLHSNLAMGLPILYIGPSGSNVDQAIERYSCGFSLRHSDPDGITLVIRKLLKKGQDYAEIRARSRQAFENEFSELKTMPLFAEVLSKLEPHRER